jgi:hypothetical protein
MHTMGAECLCEYVAMTRLIVIPAPLWRVVGISIVYILKSLLTMPPSTATSEISFSVLKRANTYLRATMGQE